jgi:Flp pilus assembly protein TadD
MPATMADIHHLMGEASQAFGRGELQRAAEYAAEVLKLAPDNPDALHLMGLCLLQAGDARRAAALIRSASLRKPGDPQLFHNLGIACAEAGDVTGALSAFTRAAMLDPGHAESRFNLGVLSEAIGDVGGAERAFRDTLLLAPTHAAAMASLAVLLEQGSALEEAGRWNDAALQAAPEEPVANLTAAQLDLRAGRVAEAVPRLERLLAGDRLTARNRALAAGRLGAAYDRLDQPEQAWPQFLAAKAALRQLPGPAQNEAGVYSLAAAARMARHAGALLERVPAAAGSVPVFLVGFPRSGTTLLDQILSGHPGVAVLEEKDTLLEVLQAHVLDDAELKRFIGLDPGGLEPWRRNYWQRVTEFMPKRDRDALFVDKLPLNSLFLPLMQRLFPAAKFLFALRDPRDVVLSCFMQSFDLNEAMRHFLSLEETARFYAAVMGVGGEAAGRLGGRVYPIRYEQVVTDTEGEARRLLDFLGLPWQPSVLDFQGTARRKRINTPSYSQVAEPIYTRAKERWRRYETQLAPVLPLLEPFVKRFGYT